MKLQNSVKEGRDSPNSAKSIQLKQVVPLDGGYGWVIVFASFMAHFILFGIWNMSGIIFIQLLEDLNTGKAETALISSISIGTMMVTGPLSSVLCNRFGPRVTSICGSIIASSGYIASFFAVDILFLYISMGVVVGLGFGIAFLPFIESIGFYFDSKKSLAVGISVCGQGVGTMVLAPVMECLLENYGWRGTMLIVGGIILNIAVIGSLLRPFKAYVDVEMSVQTDLVRNIENGYRDHTKNGHAINKPRPEQYELYLHGNAEEDVPNRVEYEQLLFQNKALPSNDEKHTKNTTIRKKVTLNPCLKVFSKYYDFSIFKNASFVLFLLSNFLVMLGIMCPYIYLPDRAVEGGRTNSESALFISVIGFANILGRVVVAIIADCSNINRQLLYTVALMICGSATIASPFNNTVIYLGTYSAIFGFSMGVFFCLFIVVLMDLVEPKLLGNATGVALLIHGIALFIGPPFVGWIYSLSKNYDCPFYASGSFIIIGGLTMCFASREKQHSSSK